MELFRERYTAWPLFLQGVLVAPVPMLETTLSILLKHESDLQRAKRWLQRPTGGTRPGEDIDPRPSRWRN